MRKWAWTLLVLSLALQGCQRGPRFVNHARPAWMVDFEVFETAGCPADQYGRRVCEGGSPLAALGCTRIAEPSALLGALEPSYPIAQCLIEPFESSEDPTGVTDRIDAEGSYLYRTGCLVPTYVRYVLFRDGEFELIRTIDEFRAIFAPADSTDEALSYALAVSSLSAKYGLEREPKLKYSVGVIEDTHVEPADDGYRVHLYRYRLCGCGPHPTSAVEVRVAADGQVEPVMSVDVYRDPAEDDLCID